MKETAPDNARELKTGGWSAHYVLIICTLLYAINYMDRQVFSVVLQPMKMDLHLTDSECGWAVTIFLLGMALFSFPIAYLVDRWSRKKSMGIMAMLWSGFTFATGLATNFISVIIPRAFVGLGEAGFVPGGTAMVGASYSKEHRGKALGIFHIAIPLGAAVGVMLGGYISAKYGWRTPFFYFAIPGIILGILAFFMKDYKTAEPTGTEVGIKGFFSALGDVIKLPTIRWFYPALGLSVFMSMSVLTWIPALIMRMLNVDESFAGMLVGGIGLAAIIGAPLGGFLSDFWQKRSPRGRMYVPAIANLIGAVLIVIVILTKFSAIGIAIAVLYGIAVSMAVPGFAVVSQEIVPVAHKGLSMGLVVFAQYLLGGAWGPYVIGAVSDALGGGSEGLGMAVMLSAIVGLAGGICFLLASRTYPADADKVKQEVILAES
ncbi:MAG: MFS transporter [Dehalococcoidia bacterium]|nr:MFS transporter [Dehalococcoidia bacterium]